MVGFWKHYVYGQYVHLSKKPRKRQIKRAFAASGRTRPPPKPNDTYTRRSHVSNTPHGHFENEESARNQATELSFQSSLGAPPSTLMSPSIFMNTGLGSGTIIDAA